jgi:hypothetical protein
MPNFEKGTLMAENIMGFTVHSHLGCNVPEFTINYVLLPVTWSKQHNLTIVLITSEFAGNGGV